MSMTSDQLNYQQRSARLYQEKYDATLKKAKKQNADRAAVGGNSRHVVLALLASGQINMRKVDSWQTLRTHLSINNLTSSLYLL